MALSTSQPLAFSSSQDQNAHRMPPPSQTLRGAASPSSVRAPCADGCGGSGHRRARSGPWPRTWPRAPPSRRILYPSPLRDHQRRNEDEHRPQCRGRGVESDQVALERGRVDAAIRGLMAATTSAHGVERIEERGSPPRHEHAADVERTTKPPPPAGRRGPRPGAHRSTTPHRDCRGHSRRTTAALSSLTRW